MDKIELYHGSEKIRQKPEKGKGKDYNDFGKGFYCTQDEDLAREWACFDGLDGYINKYTLSLEGLKIFDISKEKDCALCWLALILSNRRVRASSASQKTAMDFVMENYRSDIGEFDVIVGPRGDDSYFSFARAFLDGEISLGQLEKMLFSDKSSVQWVIVGERAFRALKFSDVSVAEGSESYYKRKERDRTMREKIVGYKEKSPVFIGDLMKR